MPAELCSTGEQKSLLVSIILAQSKCQTLHQGFAPVLLLDEAAAHLDDQKREALLEKILDLRTQGLDYGDNARTFFALKRRCLVYDGSQQPGFRNKLICRRVIFFVRH